MLRKITLLIVALSLATVTYAAPKKAARPAGGSDESIVKVLRTSNKAQTNRFVCETLEMKNVNPFDVINFFWAVTSREEGGIYSFVHPSGKSGYVVVICPEYQLPTLRKLARDLDRPNLTSAPGSKYIYYRMKHRNISNAGFRQVAQYWLGASGILWPDVETNSALFYDATAGSNNAEKAFNEILDKPLQQVEMGVNVYEVNVYNDGTLGLDFEAWKNGPGKLLGQYQATGQYFNISNVGHSHFHTSSNGVYLDYPSAFFDFLVEKGKAKSVISTKITAASRVPAVLTTGEQIPYFEISNGSTDREVRQKTADASVSGASFPTDGRTVSGGNIRNPFKSSDPSYPLAQVPQSGRPITSVIETVDTGVSLAIVPTLGEKMVNLDLNLKVVNNSGFDGAGQPLLNSRQLTDSIALAVDDEVIFGGLSREQKIKTTRKIPFFGSLPVIGYIFGGEIDSTKRTIVVAAVTPRLVKGGDNVTDADKALIKKASDEEVVTLPVSEFCFEQSAPYTW